MCYETEKDVTDISDAVGNHTHFNYSGAGSKLTQITFPSGWLDKYTWYEGCNSPANRTDRNNVTIPFIYDFECRLWRKTWPGALVTQYNYDAANRLTSATATRTATPRPAQRAKSQKPHFPQSTREMGHTSTTR